MLAFLLRRVIFAVAAFVGLTYVVWLLTTREGVVAFHALNVRSLLPPHYLTWLSHVLRGELGYSIRAQMPVARAMGNALPISLIIIGPAFVLQQGVAIWLGLSAGTRYRTGFDRFFTTASTALSGIPNFVLAVLAILLFADILHILPAGGLIDLHVVGTQYGTAEYWTYFHANTSQAISDILSHLIMPVALVAIAGIATDAQLVRLAMVDVLQEDYIRSAWSHGLPKWRVYWRHALRNVLVPLITNIGIQIPRLIFVGAIIELIFGLPGLGALFIKAVYTPVTYRDTIAPRDYDVVSAYFVVLGSVTLISTFLTDLIYALVDPRIRRVAAAPSYAPNPLVTGRPLLRLGQRTITAGTVATSLLVIFGGVVAVLSVRQIVFHKPSLTGTWDGALILVPSGAHQRAYLDIRVDANGGITGQAFNCLDRTFGTAQTQIFAVTGDTDFDSAVHMEWQSANAALFLDGSYPSDNQTLKVRGSLASTLGSQPIDVSTLRRTAPQSIDLQSFCAAAQGG